MSKAHWKLNTKHHNGNRFICIRSTISKIQSLSLPVARSFLLTLYTFVKLVRNIKRVHEFNIRFNSKSNIKTDIERLVVVSLYMYSFTFGCLCCLLQSIVTVRSYPLTFLPLDMLWMYVYFSPVFRSAEANEITHSTHSFLSSCELTVLISFLVYSVHSIFKFATERTMF